MVVLKAVLLEMMMVVQWADMMVGLMVDMKGMKMVAKKVASKVESTETVMAETRVVELVVE